MGGGNSKNDKQQQPPKDALNTSVISRVEVVSGSDEDETYASPKHSESQEKLKRMASTHFRRQMLDYPEEDSGTHDSFDDDGSIPPVENEASLLLGSEASGRAQLVGEESRKLKELIILEKTERMDIATGDFSAIWKADRGAVLSGEAQERREIMARSKSERNRSKQLLALEEIEKQADTSRATIMGTEHKQWRRIIESAIDENSDILENDIEVSAVRMIQRNYRMRAARQAARARMLMARNIRVVQRFTQTWLSQMLVQKKECHLVNVLDCQREEKDARRVTLNKEQMTWDGTIAPMIKEDRKRTEQRQAKREMEEGILREQEELIGEEAKLSAEMMEEEDTLWKQMLSGHITELKNCILIDQKRLVQAEETARITRLEGIHKQQIEEFEREEVAGRKSILDDQRQEWPILEARAATSQSKALHSTVFRMAGEQQVARDLTIEEEDADRSKIVQEEDEYFEQLERALQKSYSKKKEQEQFREEIERLRVEQEYDYVRNLFIILAEEEEWDRMEEEGYRERSRIQEAEWQSMMEQQAEERHILEEMAMQPRIQVGKAEVRHRNAIYQEFTETFLRLPYQQYLEVLTPQIHSPFQNDASTQGSTWSDSQSQQMAKEDGRDLDIDAEVSRLSQQRQSAVEARPVGVRFVGGIPLVPPPGGLAGTRAQMLRSLSNEQGFALCLQQGTARRTRPPPDTNSTLSAPSRSKGNGRRPASARRTDAPSPAFLPRPPTASRSRPSSARPASGRSAASRGGSSNVAVLPRFDIRPSSAARPLEGGSDLSSSGSTRGMRAVVPLSNPHRQRRLRKMLHVSSAPTPDYCVDPSVVPRRGGHIMHNVPFRADSICEAAPSSDGSEFDP